MREFVVDTKRGKVRQAGSDKEGEWMLKMKREMEGNLFYFCFGALGLTRMTKSLHLPICKWLTKVPPYRKMLLIPRDHLKTSMLRGLSIHYFIQERETNIYFPGMDGSETRLLYSGETATNAEHQLSWIAGHLENNTVLKGFWPHKVWRNTKKQAKRWNAKEMVLPRKTDFPEASIEAIGVGGAVTGRHYNVIHKDDLISREARNSPIVMNDAIDWHKASRALLDDPDKGLEFVIGTHWAVGDLYNDIQDNDDSVECWVRGAVEEGKPIFPEMFSLETLARLERELGELYPLLYMNTAVDPRLTDFKEGDIRLYKREGDALWFDPDERDFQGQEGRGAFEEYFQDARMTMSEAVRNGGMRTVKRIFMR